MKHRMRLQNPAVLRFGAIGAFAVMMIMMNVVAKAPFMSASWDGFKNSMQNFFEHGLGGPGMEGVGIAVAVIGVVAARMPGPIMCLLVGLVGAFAMSGVSKPLELLGQARDLIYSWMGL